MAASSSEVWNEAVAQWSRVGDLGMEAALREAGSSEERIVDILRSFETADSSDLHSFLQSCSDNELERATVFATFGRGIPPLKMSSNPLEIEVIGGTISVNEVAALCVNISSNSNINSLYFSYNKVFGTVKVCMLLGHALAINSSVHKLVLSEVNMGSEAARSLLSTLQLNKTLQTLGLGCNPLLDEGISCVAEFLSNNATVNRLVLQETSSCLEGAKQLSAALVRNTTLKELSLGVELIGREGMSRLLQPLSLDMEKDAMNSNSAKNTSLQRLELCNLNRECVESLTHMIRTNVSLETLKLSWWYQPERNTFPPLVPTDWTEHIFPALKENETLRRLDLRECEGLMGEEVYESLMDVLQNCNTGLHTIAVAGTALQSRQGQINEELRINREYRSRLKGEPQMPTTSGRVVLCGYGFAGKTEIAKTMKRTEHGTSFAHPFRTGCKKVMQSHPALQRILLGRDAHKELTARTRGFQVIVLKNQPYLKSVWDIAGQKEYYALHDYVFPDGKNSYFLYVCSCRLPPDDSDLKGRIKDESSIKRECEYWMRFLASNSRPGRVSHHGKQLPRVMFVLTKTDTLRSAEKNRIISTAEHVVREIKGVFKNVLDLCEVVEVVNAHSSRDVQRLLFASNSSLEEMLVDQLEYIVCEHARSLLEGWSRSNPLKPVLSLREFHKLCKEQGKSDRLSEDGWEIVLAYLNDLGEIIFAKNIDFIVTNPSWFGIDVLGSLINAFKGADPGVSKWTYAFGGRVECQGLYHCEGFVEKQDMKRHLERCLQSMDLQQRIPAEKLIDLMIELEMCFQNDAKEKDSSDEMETSEGNDSSDEMENSEGKDSPFFLPALFDDENELAAKGRRQLEWNLVQRGDLEYLGRRLECQNRTTTFLTPGFFPRLQVRFRNYIHKKGWSNAGFQVGRNVVCFMENGVQVCVEYAGDNDDFIDILVRSSKPYAEAVKFIEKHVVETIRTFCASPKGCQGVVLVESVIRPVCVRELHLCIKREGHSVLVSELESKLADDSGYRHTWKDALKYESADDLALDLLYGEGSLKRMRMGQVGLSPDISEFTAPMSSSTDQLPKLFYPSIEDVGILRRLETRLNATKVIPIKLHLLCDHKDGSHKVEGQPGRTVKLKAGAGGYDVPIAKLAITLLWAGVGAGASVVGASVAVPQLDDWIQSLFNVPEMPALDGEKVHQLMNPGHPRGPVSEGEILKALERYWTANPHTQGLKEMLKLDDGSSFEHDFQLEKVQYTEASHKGKIGWVCKKHFLEGFSQRILRSIPH